MPIERIEVYLNDASEPVQVLKDPPFKVKIDTRSLPDGEHTLRIVTYHKGGGREVQEKHFKVKNLPGVMLQGLEDGKEVSGDLEMTVRIGDPNIKPPRERFPGLAAAAVTVLLLLGIWGFFALTAVPDTIVEEVSKNAAAGGAGHGEGTAGAGEGATGGAVSAELIKQGEGVYQANCAGCHQANGAGLPGAFPPLANNPNLSDAKYVTEVVIKGLQGKTIEVGGQTYTGAMPGFAQLSDEEVAAVATYVMNSWGNSFGPATVEDAKAHR
ncbi:Cytochrome c-552 [Calidithermus terrae]|uniref:Cytochrome c-552 n=1 Tax=Calidithermus terrae TaxID=1408545 RepID=A0A399EQ16_9DEIN|nr:cytochrome c [Calidithermus terrae]RIH84231.1 Cytochrome c-552 [Calidithermus terrae]